MGEKIQNEEALDVNPINYLLAKEYNAKLNSWLFLEALIITFLSFSIFTVFAANSIGVNPAWLLSSFYSNLYFKICSVVMILSIFGGFINERITARKTKRLRQEYISQN